MLTKDEIMAVGKATAKYAERRLLIEALRPLAHLADCLHNAAPDDAPIPVAIGNARRARALLIALGEWPYEAPESLDTPHAPTPAELDDVFREYDETDYLHSSAALEAGKPGC